MRGRTVNATNTTFDHELAAALLTRAERDVGVVREEGGKNRGPIVNQYLALVHEAPGANWCAAALSAWLKDAYAAIGRRLACNLYSGAKLMGSELQRVGWRWVPRAEMREETVPPGSVVVFDMAQPDNPATPQNEHAATRWQGHIGVLRVWDIGTKAHAFECVEGNSGALGNEVARMPRTTRDTRIMGACVPVLARAAA